MKPQRKSIYCTLAARYSPEGQDKVRVARLGKQRVFAQVELFKVFLHKVRF